MDLLDKLSEKNPGFFKQILEEVKDAILITDAVGVVLWLNEASEGMCGLPKSKVIGRTVQELESKNVFNPSVARMAIEAKKSVGAIQQVSQQRRFVATGHLVHDKNENIIAAFAHARDITKVVHQTNEIKEMQDLLATYSAEIRKLSTGQFSQQREAVYAIIDKSQQRTAINELIQKVALVDTTVLIVGETGTGKSVAAERIHRLSERHNEPFIQVNCSSLPASLLESELYGYEKGSFTGASSSGKIGLIAAAEGGTLFLDEIGELPLNLQANILHFLQSKEYLPIGARKYKKANVRIVTATNRKLEEMVQAGAFRSDLFYRLNVLSLKMPPLRNSIDDIEEIAQFYLTLFNKQYNVNKVFSREVLQCFLSYNWPGNLRELSNLTERLVILSETDSISLSDLPTKMTVDSKHTSQKQLSVSPTFPLPKILNNMEKELIIEALEKTHSTRKAAQYLGVSQSYIMRRIKKYQLDIFIEEQKITINKAKKTL